MVNCRFAGLKRERGFLLGVAHISGGPTPLPVDVVSVCAIVSFGGWPHEDLVYQDADICIERSVMSGTIFYDVTLNEMYVTEESLVVAIAAICEIPRDHVELTMEESNNGWEIDEDHFCAPEKNG